MSKKDLGDIYKEKHSRNGIVYFSEMMDTMFLVVADTDSGETVYSRAFPYTKETKKAVRKSARNNFNTILYRMNNSLELEAD